MTIKKPALLGRAVGLFGGGISLSINRPKSHTAGYSSFGTHAIRTLRCRHRLAIA